MIGIKCEKLRRYLERERQILPEFFCCMDGVKNLKFCIDVQLSAGDNPLLKVVPPADRRGAQMKTPSERASRGKYAGGVLEFKGKV